MTSPLPHPPESAARGPALSRRTLFTLAGAGLAATGIAPLAAQTRSGFTHGVASGEPGADRVLLWTRYVGSGDTDLRYELARDLSFARPVAGGTLTASPARDWCAKTMAEGLEPDSWYYYRFIAPDGAISDIGRTRTLPEGPVARWRMAVFSCANMGFGWFNAYAHAAAANEFDLAVHTGDYFYEYPPGNYPSADQAIRTAAPASETVTLADYRARHAAYRQDSDLQRLHQLYPMILVWDDHETANDSWQHGAENHQPETEGSWDTRKSVALRAYREWLPVSDADWASYDIGNLATIFRLETRLTARAEQFDLGAVLAGARDPQAAQAALVAFRDGAFRDPARELLGAQQQAWLADGLRRSSRAGRRWQVLAQQVIMGNLRTPASLASALGDSVPDYLRQRLTASIAASRLGLPFNMDAWDGYPAARERLLRAALDADANLVVLTGDTHNAWAFDLDLDGARAGVEFAGQSVTSPGAEGYLAGIDPATFARDAVAENGQLQWADTARRGYMAVELTPAAATCEWRFLDTIRSRSATLAGTHQMASAAGEKRLAG